MCVAMIFIKHVFVLLQEYCTLKQNIKLLQKQHCINSTSLHGHMAQATSKTDTVGSMYEWHPDEQIITRQLVWRNSILTSGV